MVLLYRISLKSLKSVKAGMAEMCNDHFYTCIVPFIVGTLNHSTVIIENFRERL